MATGIKSPILAFVRVWSRGTAHTRRPPFHLSFSQGQIYGSLSRLDSLLRPQWVCPLSEGLEFTQQVTANNFLYSSMKSLSEFSVCAFVLQCHEASIAIYSSMENQRLCHWAFISVVSMIFCLIIYSLTGETSACSTFTSPLAHPLTGARGPTVFSSLLCCRRLWVSHVWKRREGWYFDVVHQWWRSDGPRQAAFWSLHCHHLSHHAAAGQVRPVAVVN